MCTQKLKLVTGIFKSLVDLSNELLPFSNGHILGTMEPATFDDLINGFSLESELLACAPKTYPNTYHVEHDIVKYIQKFPKSYAPLLFHSTLKSKHACENAGDLRKCNLSLLHHGPPLLDTVFENLSGDQH